ncbi:MAG: pyridoxamine 5'-phosphate oxidase family protein, partial [Microthrixaceae bacterium]
MTMRMIDDRTGLEVLAQDECLRLLHKQGVGRVAVVAGGRPMIFPVNYVVDGRTIVFRTDEGT